MQRYNFFREILLVEKCKVDVKGATEKILTIFHRKNANFVRPFFVGQTCWSLGRNAL
jgi:hypothetical protein